MGASPPKPRTKLPQGFAGGVNHRFNHFHAELAARPDSILLRKINTKSPNGTDRMLMAAVETVLAAGQFRLRHLPKGKFFFRNPKRCNH